jgi:hypothetical protein
LRRKKEKLKLRSFALRSPVHLFAEMGYIMPSVSLPHPNMSPFSRLASHPYASVSRKTCLNAFAAESNSLVSLPHPVVYTWPLLSKEEAEEEEIHEELM